MSDPFSTAYPPTHPTAKLGWYWVGGTNDFANAGWECFATPSSDNKGCGKPIKPNTVVAVYLNDEGVSKLGWINCAECAVKNGHGWLPAELLNTASIGSISVALKTPDGKSDYSYWMKECPESTECTNSVCLAPIPQGSPCVKHKNTSGYGCVKCAHYWTKDPMPAGWDNYTVPGMGPKKIISFGMKFGPFKESGICVVDVRKKVRNPWREKDLRKLVGYDPKILEFVGRCGGAQKIIDYWSKYMASSAYSGVAFGCHGGKHRSVAMAELLAQRMITDGLKVEVVHRDVQRGK